MKNFLKLAAILIIAASIGSVQAAANSSSTTPGELKPIDKAAIRLMTAMQKGWNLEDPRMRRGEIVHKPMTEAEKKEYKDAALDYEKFFIDLGISRNDPGFPPGLKESLVELGL